MAPLRQRIAHDQGLLATHHDGVCLHASPASGLRTVRTYTSKSSCAASTPQGGGCWCCEGCPYARWYGEPLGDAAGDPLLVLLEDGGQGGLDGPAGPGPPALGG